MTRDLPSANPGAPFRRWPGIGRRALRASFLLIFLGMTGCGRQRSIGPATASGELPDQEVQDFVLTETDAGLIQWKLYARNAAIYEARNRILVRSVRIDFYNELGKKSSELTAREGEINQLTRDMTATGHVVLQTTEGTRMSTEQMSFGNRNQKVTSDRLVRVERAGDVLSGYGFESDPELTHFEFKRQVSATVRTRSGGVLTPRENPR